MNDEKRKEIIESRKDWPEWARVHYPIDDFDGWTPITSKHALARKVLCVAKTRIEGSWAAYCDAVPGIDHSREMAEVLRAGDKLGERIARHLFPQFDGIPYAG